MGGDAGGAAGGDRGEGVVAVDLGGGVVVEQGASHVWAVVLLLGIGLERVAIALGGVICVGG